MAPSQPGTAGRDRQDVGVQGEDQRGQGHNQHEDHGDVEHLVVLTCISKPCANSQKRKGGKEGKLGVEGMRPEVLKEALLRAGATVVGEASNAQTRRAITRSDLFTAPLTGCAGSQERRKKLLHQLDLPEHLSTKALLQVLNQLMSYEEYTKVIQTL